MEKIIFDFFIELVFFDVYNNRILVCNFYFYLLSEEGRKNIEFLNFLVYIYVFIKFYIV